MVSLFMPTTLYC